MGKVVSKVAKTVSKFAGSKFADPLGISKSVSLSPVEDMLAGKSSSLFANKDLEKAAAADKLQQQRDAQMQDALNASARVATNANVDLGMENTPVVDVGGTATGLNTSANRRRRGGAGISTSLGINS